MTYTLHVFQTLSSRRCKDGPVKPTARWTLLDWSKCTPRESVTRSTNLTLSLSLDDSVELVRLSPSLLPGEFPGKKTYETPIPARMMAEHRAASDSGSTLGRAGSVASSSSKFAPPPSRFSPAAGGSNDAAPPPPYSGGSAAAPVMGKKAPPPPPARMGSSTVTYVTALYDYAATVRLFLFLVAAPCPQALSLTGLS